MPGAEMGGAKTVGTPELQAICRRELPRQRQAVPPKRSKTWTSAVESYTLSPEELPPMSFLSVLGPGTLSAGFTLLRSVGRRFRICISDAWRNVRSTSTRLLGWNGLKVTFAASLALCVAPVSSCQGPAP